MKRLVVLALTLAACGSPPPPKPAPKSAPKPPPVPELAEVAPQETYAYSPIGKRDPFRSPIDDLVVAIKGELQCPLCKWEVDQLHLVAVVTGTGNPVAMVEDPDGVGHVVRQGTQVGKHNGKVTAIRRDELLVVETTHDTFGKTISNKTLLKIPRNPADATQATSLLDE
jgi:type IV pilus assembly protein PilP